MRVVVGVATVEGGIEENDKDEAQRNARGENNEGGGEGKIVHWTYFLPSFSFPIFLSLCFPSISRLSSFSFLTLFHSFPFLFPSLFFHSSHFLPFIFFPRFSFFMFPLSLPLLRFFSSFHPSIFFLPFLSPTVSLSLHRLILSSFPHVYTLFSFRFFSSCLLLFLFFFLVIN